MIVTLGICITSIRINAPHAKAAPIVVACAAMIGIMLIVNIIANQQPFITTPHNTTSASVFLKMVYMLEKNPQELSEQLSYSVEMNSMDIN